MCIGPVGAPVSGLDRLILQLIQEEEPGVMENWYAVLFLTHRWDLIVCIVSCYLGLKGPMRPGSTLPS